MACSKSNSKRKVYSNTSSLRKQEKSQINNLTLYLKALEKKYKAQSSRRKEIIKIGEEISEIATKKQWRISMKLKTGSLKR